MHVRIKSERTKQSANLAAQIINSVNTEVNSIRLVLDSPLSVLDKSSERLKAYNLTARVDSSKYVPISRLESYFKVRLISVYFFSFMFEMPTQTVYVVSNFRWLVFRFMSCFYF